jgi:2-dehydropantoate 2-reductase
MKPVAPTLAPGNLQDIAVIGVGGVGGYFGGKLCRVSGINVSFIARGEHLRSIQQSGLLLSSEHDGDIVCKPSLATDDFKKLPPLDLCLLCVKEFDLPGVLSRLEPLVRNDTIILPLLNGVDVYARVRAVIGQGIVVPACVYVGTHIESAGKVVQRGGACRILFGPDPLRPDFAPDRLLQLFEEARIRAEWTPHVETEIWKKFIFICAFGLVSAASDKTLGEILGDETLRNNVQHVMREAVSLAHGLGVPLPDDIIDASIAKARTFPPEARTSFQRDFARPHKNDERDLFAGSMVRIANELRSEIPKTSEIAGLLERKKPRRTTGAS